MTDGDSPGDLYGGTGSDAWPAGPSDAWDAPTSWADGGSGEPAVDPASGAESGDETPPLTDAPHGSPDPSDESWDHTAIDATDSPAGASGTLADPLLGDGRQLAAFGAVDWAPVDELPSPGAEPTPDPGADHPGPDALADLARTWSVAAPAGGPPFDAAAPAGELLRDISLRAADPDLRDAAAVAVRLLPEQPGPDRV